MMCLGGYLTYECLEMSNTKYLLMKNVEALTQGEATLVGMCARRSGPSGQYGSRMFCDSRTNSTMIYPCPTTTSNDLYIEGNMDRCSR